MKKNDVSSFSQSPLIGSLSNLQVMSTGIKAQTSSNLGRIGLFTLELFALEHRFLIFNDKRFLLTSKFCPQGVVSPFHGDIYMYKIMKKNCIKSYKEFFFFF